MSDRQSDYVLVPGPEYDALIVETPLLEDGSL